MGSIPTRARPLHERRVRLVRATHDQVARLYTTGTALRFAGLPHDACLLEVGNETDYAQ